MNIQITGDGLTLTPAISATIKNKFGHLEDHYNKITSLKVTLKGKEGFKHKISADVYLAGDHLHANALHEDLYQAIDDLKDKVIKQVDKHHDIIMQRHHHQGSNNSESRYLGGQEE